MPKTIVASYTDYNETLKNELVQWLNIATKKLLKNPEYNIFEDPRNSFNRLDNKIEKAINDFTYNSKNDTYNNTTDMYLVYSIILKCAKKSKSQKDFIDLIKRFINITDFNHGHIIIDMDSTLKEIDNILNIINDVIKFVAQTILSNEKYPSTHMKFIINEFCESIKVLLGLRGAEYYSSSISFQLYDLFNEYVDRKRKWFTPAS